MLGVGFLGIIGLLSGIRVELRLDRREERPGGEWYLIRSLGILL